MRYALWISVTLVYNFLACWLAVRCNARAFIANWLGMAALGLIPTWALAAYFSRNLLADSLLFDALLVLSSLAFLAALGQGEHLSRLNWVGIALTLLGLLLAKW